MIQYLQKVKIINYLFDVSTMYNKRFQLHVLIFKRYFSRRSCRSHRFFRSPCWSRGGHVEVGFWSWSPWFNWISEHFIFSRRIYIIIIYIKHITNDGQPIIIGRRLMSSILLWICFVSFFIIFIITCRIIIISWKGMTYITQLLLPL